MDADTTVKKNAYKSILEAFRKHEADILIGTQMIAKGHDFPKVTLSAILAADSMLNSGEYSASEKTFQFITQAAGRAGRAESEGIVLIQAYSNDDYAIRHATTHNYEAFFKDEIRIREELNYPPFTNIGLIIFSSMTENNAIKYSNILKDFLIKNEEIEVLRTSKAPLSMLKNKYRYRIIVKSRSVKKLLTIFSNLIKKYEKKMHKEGVSLSVDINPNSML